MNQQTETSGKIRFPLLSNGLDFILSAVEHLSGIPSHRDHKYAILHLSSGIELVLKERLRREHWLLVAQNPGKLNIQAYKSGDFKSVSFDECVERIRNCGVRIEDKAIHKLKSYRNDRNRIEHFDMEDTVEAIKSSTATVLNVVFDFIHTELDPSTLDRKDQNILEKIHQRIFELQSFVKARLQEIEPELRQARDDVFTCSQCFQDTAVIGEGLKCLFCRYTASGKDAAEDYIFRVLGQSKAIKDVYGESWPQHRCLNCDHETLVDLGASGSQPPSVQFFCFNCWSPWKEDSLKQCSYCRNLYESGRGYRSLCEDCTEEWFTHDD